MKYSRWYRLAFALPLVLACSLFSSPAVPAPDLPATLRSSTPLASTQEAAPFTPAARPSDGPPGKIIYTCNVFKADGTDQICMINADGSGFRRLTQDGSRKHYYASPAPDGKSIVYAAFRQANVYEIYEMDLEDGSTKQLTDRLGVLNAPEISPDGKQVIFMHWIAATDRNEIWVMGRDGSNPHRMFDITGWDPTWSPDGSRVLFASTRSGSNQLWSANTDGSGLHQVSDLPALRGRSDWSPLGQIVTYSGTPWAREIYLMNPDGSNQRQISPSGGNSQGPAFSPDGEWVAFTGYFDHFEDILGCEIYIMRSDGTDMRRLTYNDYCDYQPRWGP